MGFPPGHADDVLAIDDDWCVTHARGFTWWSGRHALRCAAQRPRHDVGFDVVCVRVAIDLLSVTPDGFVLEEVAPGLTAEEVQAASAAKLILPDTVRTIAA